MSKLIITTADVAGGGAARVLSVLSKPLADAFDEVQIVCWSHLRVFYTFDERVKIIHLPLISNKKSRYGHLLAFRRYIRKERPDLVLCVQTPINMLALAATTFMSVKFVVAERTDPKRSVAGGKAMLWLRDFLYRRPLGILAQTEYAKSCYKGALGRKTTVIYNPMPMGEEYVGKALRTEKRNEIVTVGRFFAVKDLPTMIDAFAIFHRTHPDYHLVIYGFGPLKGEIEAKIERDGLKDAVVLGGTRNDVWDCIVGSQMFVLSSIVEGMSNALAEAMCLGLPVISTKVAGATDLIHDGENGYLVNVKDVVNMADRMCLLADDDKLREQMGREAAKVYEILREDKISKQWIDYLKSIIN